MNKVLIADNVSDAVFKVFDKNNIEYTQKIGLTEDELALEIIGFSGLVIRSAVTVTKKIIDSAVDLKVIGRPGVGVDNVDLNAASNKNIVVMNTPMGNVQATAELTFSLIHSLMRRIPEANQTMHDNKWEKKSLIGSEMHGKTIGIIGFGNIGKKVAEISRAYGMNIVVYSESLDENVQDQYGVTKKSVNELLSDADIITFHNKLSDKTKFMINRDTLKKIKNSSIIINCARGGIINENDIKEALLSGEISGYVCDVYENEPELKSIFSGMPNVVMTPHIGASTREAQEKVAVQIAEQMSDFLLNNKIINQVNK